MIANVTETIATDFVSSFVDHRPEVCAHTGHLLPCHECNHTHLISHCREQGDILWLSALNNDRCRHSSADSVADRSGENSGGGCGTGVKAISSTDLVHFTTAMALPDVGTCNTGWPRHFETFEADSSLLVDIGFKND